MFTEIQIQAAKATKDKLLNGEWPPDLKSLYMAGEIVMWDEMTKKQKFTVELCECGHESPVEFNIYDEDGNGTCPQCVTDELVGQIKELKETLILTSKSLATYGSHPIIEKAVKHALSVSAKTEC